MTESNKSDNFETVSPAVAPTAFVTSSGRRLDLLPVPVYLVDRVITSVKMPDPPTYQTTTAAGTTETFPHDETTLQTDDDRRAWAAYRQATRAAQSALQTRVIRLLILYGIATNPPAPGDPGGGWQARQQSLGITEIPTDPDELKTHWIMTECLRGADDITSFIVACLRLTGVDEAAITAAENSFRGHVRGDPVTRPAG